MAELEIGARVRMTGAPGWAGEIVEVLPPEDRVEPQVKFRNDGDGKIYQFRAGAFVKA